MTQIRPHATGYTPTHFEVRTDKMIERNTMRRNMETLRAERQRNLERRRMALANLIREDEQKYMAEFEAMRDTPEKQKEKTKQRAFELKSKREAEDRAKTTTVMERKFQDESDEIRTMRSQQEALHIASDQLLQIAQKRTEKGRQVERDAFWARVWEEDIQRKNEDDARRKAKLKEGIAEVQEKRREQVAELRERKMKEEQLKKEEDELQKEYWEMKRRLDLEDQEAKEIEKKMKFKEYQRFSKVAEAKRLREQAQKRQEELEFIQGVLEREHQEDLQEEAARQRNRAELIAQRQQQLAEMMEAKEDERELDRLIAIEDEKEYQKRKAVWDKEDAWRKKLLHDVLEDRARHIQMRREQKLKELEDNYADAAAILADVERQNKEEEAKAAERAMRARDCADSQRKQMDEKREKRTAADLQEAGFDAKDREYNMQRTLAEDRAKRDINKDCDSMRKYVHDLQEDVEEQPVSQPKARQLQYREDIAKETRARTLTRSMGAAAATAASLPPAGSTSNPYGQDNPYQTGVTRGIGSNPHTRGRTFQRTSLW